MILVLVDHDRGELDPLSLRALTAARKLGQDVEAVVIGKDYPANIVDMESSGKTARELIWGHRTNETVKQENIRILYTHTRRKENDIQPS